MESTPHPAPATHPGTTRTPDELAQVASGEMSVSIDWKETAEDALLADAPDMDLEDWLPHLARALEASGLSLHDGDRQSDAYELRLVPLHQIDALEATAQQQSDIVMYWVPAKKPSRRMPRAKPIASLQGFSCWPATTAALLRMGCGTTAPT